MRALALAAITLLSGNVAQAAPDPGWAEHADTLARIVVLESDHRPADWAAVLWVLEHRRDRSRSSHAATYRYCAAITHGKSARAVQILRAPLAELPPIRRAQIDEARAFVDAWLEGEVMDPCPRAMHWAGKSDDWPASLRVDDCGKTANTFGHRS